jgi:hypothetical protein
MGIYYKNLHPSEGISPADVDMVIIYITRKGLRQVIKSLAESASIPINTDRRL